MPSVAQIPRGAVLAGVGSGGGRWPEVMPELGRKGEQELAGLEGVTQGGAAGRIWEPGAAEWACHPGTQLVRGRSSGLQPTVPC